MPYANINNFNRKRRRDRSCDEEEDLMPPEPLPWDRKGGGGGEFFRDRGKHGNGQGYGYEHSNNIGSGGGGGGGNGPGGRWRDSASPFAGSRNNNDFSPRWGYGSGSNNEFRRPSGHGKQGGWHMYHEDSGHGYSTPRSGDRFIDDDCFRPSGTRGDGRYGRMYRDNRSGFSQKEWRGHTWENNHHYSGPSNTPGRPQNVNDQRSVGDSPPLRASHPNADSSGQSHLKDQPDKTSDANGSGPSQRADKENSLGPLDWKPLKWSRSGSLTSRGSGLSHSSSSKSTGGESSDKGDLPRKNPTPLQSPSGDGAACIPAAISSEEAASRKKPRLGWGEGLAKYEKKKVDGPEDIVSKDGNMALTCNVEPLQSLSSNLVDKSPKITGFSDCSSPATPSSFACSSSPGMEEKTYGKSTDGNGNNFSVSSMPVPENQPDALQFSLEKLELNSITNLSSLLNELLQVDDRCSMDSGFMRSSVSNKLLLWKGDISKELELTETEIDSLENEMKSLKADSGQDVPCPSSWNSLRANEKDGHPDGLDGFARPAPLEVISSADVIMEDTLPCHDVGGVLDESKTGDIDSPGTATSKLVEPLRTLEPVSSCALKNLCGIAESAKSMAGSLNTCIDEVTAVGRSGQGHGTKVIKDDSVAALNELSSVRVKEDNICDVILASNKDTAAKASDVLNKLLPICGVDSMEVARPSCFPTDSVVKEKFLRRKRSLRFKERVISMKYRVFHHLWKEDHSLRSQRTKLQKKLDLTSRTMQMGSQKHRSSIRSRFASPAGSLSLVPTTEVLNFTSKLLSDPEVKIYRDSLKMPAMILDEKEKMSSRFVSCNGLVEDPCAVEKERALINPWTIEEKEIFMDKLATCGKDFRKIASFLDHKTTADCIEFYYKNHKSESFRKTKKLDEKKEAKPLSSNTYLLTSGKKWSRDMNAASLDILGAASVIAAQADQAMKTPKLLSGKSSNRKSRGSDGVVRASNHFYATEDERETAAADVLAGICGSLSSEAMSSCITSSVDPGEANPEWKQQKVGSSVKRPLTPDVTQNVDDDTCSNESCGEMDPVDWTDDEKSLFVRAFSSHGKDFLMISRFVRSKSRDQCKVFFSKARKCLGLDTLHPGTGSGGILGSNDTNGGGSDTEDACVAETSSVVCSDKSGSRMDEDLPPENQDVSKPDVACATDLNTLDENCSQGQVKCKDSEMEPEVLCPGESLVNVSDGGLGVLADGQKAADAIQRPVVHIITQDGTLKSGVIDPHSNSLIINRRTVGTINDGEPSVCNSPSDSSQDGQCNQSSGGKLYNQYCGRSTSEGGSPQDFKGFPLDMSIKAEINDTATRKTADGKVQSFHLRKCSRSASQDSVAELPLLCKKENRTNDSAGVSSSSEAEKSCSSGDVKLFGKFLSKPSSAEKPTSCVQGHDEKAKNLPAFGGKLNVKLAANQEASVTSTSGKHDVNCFLGLENVPIRSYGFWDGTKMQTGFPSVTDSALLLAKYPAAFGNYSVSSSKTEQPLQAAVNSNECNLNGACVFSPREFNSANGSVIDCPVFRNQEGIQPFMLDVKQRLDVYPEVHRNGFETTSSLQQHEKGLLKLNSVQGGDVQRGPCVGVSDAVAAFRLQYPQQYSGSGHAVNGIIREEPWRGQGDLGR